VSVAAVPRIVAMRVMRKIADELSLED
jgi:hypothetical protein